MAEGSLLPSASAASAAVAAAFCAATSTTTSSSSSSSSQRCCPQLIFLSQNDPGDNVAALLRSVEGVASVDLTGLQLSSKVSVRDGICRFVVLHKQQCCTSSNVAEESSKGQQQKL
jgi:hypothetical protein